MQKTRVCVLRGGPGNGYEKSLRTGEMVMRHLSPEDFDVHDIFISKESVWHKQGLEIAPHDALIHADVVWNALHSSPQGDDVEHLLEQYKIPFTGSGIFARAVASNAVHFKESLKRENIRTLPFRLVEIPTDDSPGEELASLFRTYAPPLIIRPVPDNGEVIIAKTFSSFTDALGKAFEHADAVMIEEYIPGTPVSVGVIDGYRGHERYALPPLGMDGFTHEEKRALEDLARRVHEVLGLRHYSKTDLLVTPRRGVFVTGVSVAPELHEESIFHRSLHSVGAPMSHFLNHVLTLAIMR